MKKTKMSYAERRAAQFEYIDKLGEMYEKMDADKAEKEFENRFTTWECSGFRRYKNKRNPKLK